MNLYFVGGHAFLDEPFFYLLAGGDKIIHIIVDPVGVRGVVGQYPDQGDTAVVGLFEIGSHSAREGLGADYGIGLKLVKEFFQLRGVVLVDSLFYLKGLLDYRGVIIEIVPDSGGALDYPHIQPVDYLFADRIGVVKGV